MRTCATSPRLRRKGPRCVSALKLEMLFAHLSASGTACDYAGQAAPATNSTRRHRPKLQKPAPLIPVKAPITITSGDAALTGRSAIRASPTRLRVVASMHHFAGKTRKTDAALSTSDYRCEHDPPHLPRRQIGTDRHRASYRPRRSTILGRKMRLDAWHRSLHRARHLLGKVRLRRIARSR